MNDEEWNVGLEEIKLEGLTEKEKELAKQYAEIELDFDEILSEIKNNEEK